MRTLKDLKQLAGRPTGRGVHATKCRICHLPILTGLDADQAAISASVEWLPLDPIGEFLALISGRATYRLDRQAGGNPKLTHRKAGDIRKPRKRWHFYDIVPAHICGAGQLPATESRLVRTIAIDPNEPCPF